MNWLRYEELPEVVMPFAREWFALRLDAIGLYTNLSRTDIANVVQRIPGEWRYARAEDVHQLLRAPAANQENTEQLRKLQEQLAAKQSVLDRIHEWSAPNRI